MVRLRLDVLFRADVTALERLARWLGLPESKRWRTERERKARIVEAIERHEKQLAKRDRRGPRARTGVGKLLPQATSERPPPTPGT